MFFVIYCLLPKLATWAKKYLSAAVSSVYSERLFSEAGNIYEKKHKGIFPENTEERFIFAPQFQAI